MFNDDGSSFDFLDRIQSSAENLFNQSIDEFTNFGADKISEAFGGSPLIVSAPVPKGNQTSQQVSAGQNGAPAQPTIQQRAGVNSSGLKGGFGFDFSKVQESKFFPFAIIAGFVGLALLLRRR